MNIYKVELPDDITLDYDSYQGFVVIAPSSKVARSLHPGTEQEIKTKKSSRPDKSWVQAEDIDRLKVTKLGKASSKYDTIKVVLKDFISG